nr:MAG TPA: hypothetical protein [Caudoviricetes sp.]
MIRVLGLPWLLKIRRWHSKELLGALWLYRCVALGYKNRMSAKVLIFFGGLFWNIRMSLCPSYRFIKI